MQFSQTTCYFLPHTLKYTSQKLFQHTINVLPLISYKIFTHTHTHTSKIKCFRILKFDFEIGKRKVEILNLMGAIIP
jgi:hypothetical protein